MNYYDFDDAINTESFTIEALPYLWRQFDIAKFSYISDLDKWDESKFLKNDGTIEDKISNVDNGKGGIYVFFIKPDIIPGIHVNIMYIGRALKTNGQNLRKRLLEYFRDYIANANPETRSRKVEKVFRKWKEYLHVKYLLLGDSNGNKNNEIKELERELIKAIRPPYNDDIPTIEFKTIKTGEEVFA